MSKKSFPIIFDELVCMRQIAAYNPELRSNIKDFFYRRTFNKVIMEVIAKYLLYSNYHKDDYCFEQYLRNYIIISLCDWVYEKCPTFARLKLLSNYKIKFDKELEISDFDNITDDCKEIVNKIILYSKGILTNNDYGILIKELCQYIGIEENSPLGKRIGNLLDYGKELFFSLSGKNITERLNRLNTKLDINKDYYRNDEVISSVISQVKGKVYKFIFDMDEEQFEIVKKHMLLKEEKTTSKTTLIRYATILGMILSDIVDKKNTENLKVYNPSVFKVYFLDKDFALTNSDKKFVFDFINVDDHNNLTIKKDLIIDDFKFKLNYIEYSFFEIIGKI